MPGKGPIKDTSTKVKDIKDKKEMKPGKSRLEKIKEEINKNPKRPGFKNGSKPVPSKLKGFSRLPEKIQRKINKKLAKKV